MAGFAVSAAMLTLMRFPRVPVALVAVIGGGGDDRHLAAVATAGYVPAAAAPGLDDLGAGLEWRRKRRAAADPVAADCTGRGADDGRVVLDQPIEQSR